MKSQSKFFLMSSNKMTTPLNFLEPHITALPKGRAKKYNNYRLSEVATMAGIAIFYAVSSGSAFAAQTTGGVNWMDLLKYKKPAFYSITIPDEASVSNKYWVDLSSGSGTACTSSSPCSWSTVQTKPGVTGGPAYIYIKGTGSVGSPTMYGTAGNEVVIKPWDNATLATITGRNNWTTQQQHVIWDGGPNLNIHFSNTTGGQFDPSVYFNAKSGLHSDITIYRTQWNVTGSGEWVAQWGMFSNLRFINNEFYSTSSDQSQHHLYFSGASNYGQSSGLEIKNNVFRDTPGEAIEFRMYQNLTDVTIDGNAFHDIGKGTCSTSWKCRSPITLADSGGTASNVTISNNLIWDTGEGIVRCWNSGGSKIYNNTIYNWGMGSPANGGYGQWAFFGYSKDGTCFVKNNIIYATGNTANGYKKIPIDASPIITGNASNNICLDGQNCGASSQVYSATLLSTDPTNTGFLQPNLSDSNLIKGANLSFSGVRVDYRLISRPSSASFTIGAIEATQENSVSLSTPQNLHIQ